MQITAISDLHGHYPRLPSGDLLVIAGDITAKDDPVEWGRFFHWLGKQEFDKKLIMGGNHDKYLEENFEHQELTAEEIDKQPFIYMEGTITTYKDVVIAGSPISVYSSEVNPSCNAFMLPEEEVEEIFSYLIEGIDILITHFPPYGILDKTEAGKHIGSKAILEAVKRVKPKVHIFGHNHFEGCKAITHHFEGGETLFVNAAICDEQYKYRDKCLTFKYG